MRTPFQRRLRRATILATLAVVAASSLLVAPATASSAVAAGAVLREPARLDPAQLPRGEDTRLLHTEGSVIVDDDSRVRVRAAHVILEGRSGRDYVVSTYDGQWENWRVVRVARDGSSTVLVRNGQDGEVDLSIDGSKMVLSLGGRGTDSRFQVRDTATGAVLQERVFRDGAADVLAFSKSRILLSEGTSKRTRTFWWNPVTDRTERVSRFPSYFADLEANRLGQLLGDPYQGGCQRLVGLHRPSNVLWRSCRERVASVSPDGKRLIAVGILTDGAGPLEVKLRKGTGRLLRTYRADAFGFLVWEGRHRPLLQIAGKRSAAMARCSLSDCELGSRRVPLEGQDWWQAMEWSFVS